jgi:glycosyltransferase involved in cell wall biosynthesis
VRVLAVSPDYLPAQGGIQTLAHRITTQLPEASTRVVTLRSAGSDEFDLLQPVPVRRVSTTALRSVDILRLNSAVLTEAIRHRPDVILSLHIVTAPAAIALQALLRVPYVQYVYAKEIEGRPGLARRALRGADRVLALGTYSESLCLAAGASPERTRIVAPGVDLAERPVNAPTRVPGQLVTVARLADRYKGHDVTLRALGLVRAAHPAVHWRVLGSGPLRPYLESLASALHVDDAVSFEGSVTDAERSRALWESEVFVMPSRVPAGGAGEGFGIVYLEAGSAELPVIGAKEGGAVDAVIDGETGLLVDPQDHVELAAAILGLLGDRELRQRFGAAGRSLAERSTWRQAAVDVRRVLAEVA